MHFRILASVQQVARGRKWTFCSFAATSTKCSSPWRHDYSISTSKSDQSKKDPQRHKHFIYENRSQQNFRQSEKQTSASSTAPQPRPRPLDGITVIALEQVIAGPYCTRQLAELGARVVKIERPGQGDFARSYDTRAAGLSSHFAWTNRSKQSLALDVKKGEDLALLKKLITKADVFLQNLAPGAADRLGLSYEELSKTNERLIVCDISGYGADGPYRNKKAYDLLIQAEAGVLSVTGTEETPSKVGASVADIAAAMYAYSNIMAALLVRAKSGKGCRIDVSMLEVSPLFRSSRHPSRRPSSLPPPSFSEHSNADTPNSAWWSGWASHCITPTTDSAHRQEPVLLMPVSIPTDHFKPKTRPSCSAYRTSENGAVFVTKSSRSPLSNQTLALQAPTPDQRTEQSYDRLSKRCSRVCRPMKWCRD